MKNKLLEELKLICDFCGGPMERSSSRKYCSKRCSSTASRRKTAMNLGIPGPKNYGDPLQAPWLE